MDTQLPRSHCFANQMNNCYPFLFFHPKGKCCCRWRGHTTPAQSSYPKFILTRSQSLRKEIKTHIFPSLISSSFFPAFITKRKKTQSRHDFHLRRVFYCLLSGSTVILNFNKRATPLTVQTFPDKISRESVLPTASAELCYYPTHGRCQFSTKSWSVIIISRITC